MMLLFKMNKGSFKGQWSTKGVWRFGATLFWGDLREYLIEWKLNTEISGATNSRKTYQSCICCQYRLMDGSWTLLECQNTSPHIPTQIG